MSCITNRRGEGTDINEDEAFGSFYAVESDQ